MGGGKRKTDDASQRDHWEGLRWDVSRGEKFKDAEEERRTLAGKLPPGY